MPPTSTVLPIEKSRSRVEQIMAYRLLGSPYANKHNTKRLSESEKTEIEKTDLFIFLKDKHSWINDNPYGFRPCDDDEFDDGCLAFIFGMITGWIFDLHGIILELVQKQRAIANICVLMLSLTLIATAVIVTVAFAVSNPVGWSILFGVGMAVALTLLIRPTRVLATAIDAALDKNSCLVYDSRFKLVPSEDEINEKTCKKRGYSSDSINTAIESLAVRAWNEPQFTIFGTSSSYNNIIDKVTALRNGEITNELATELSLTCS